MRKKIALYIPSMNSGGAEKIFQIICNKLVEKDYEVDLLLSKVEGHYLQSLDDRVKIIELGGRSVKKDFFYLIKYFYKYRPDYALSALSHSNIIMLLSKFFIFFPIKMFVSEHSVTSGYNSLNKNSILNFLIKFTYIYADGIIAVSETTKVDLIENYSFNEKKVKVIYNPVLTKSLDSLLLDNIKDFNFDIRKGFYIYVGRLEKEKNIIFLIDNIKSFLINENKTLLIFGIGSLENEIVELINKNNLGKYVKLYGFNNNPYKYMKKADALIMPSLFEGFGNVAIEALYAGTKVLISDKAKAAIEITRDTNNQAIYFNPLSGYDLLRKLKQLDNSSGVINDEYFNQFKEEYIINQYIQYLETGR